MLTTWPTLTAGAVNNLTVSIMAPELTTHNASFSLASENNPHTQITATVAVTDKDGKKSNQNYIKVSKNSLI